MFSSVRLLYTRGRITMQVNAISSTDETTQQTTATTAASEDFSSYLDDAQDNSLESIFENAAGTYGVSVNLLTAMAKQESGFQSDATSTSGAMGIMQLMPATATSLGCTDAYDPEQNIMAGAKYISQLLDKYNGDTSLALAAYNAGSGNVDKYGGIPPFEETQNYVAKITAYMNEGVTLPDGFTTSGTSTDSALTSASFTDLDANTLKDILNQVFSYDDYLKFINIFVSGVSDLIASYDSTNLTTDSTDPTDTQASATIAVSVTSSNAPEEALTAASSDTYYAYQNINYNNAVLNLLNQNSSDSL